MDDFQALLSSACEDHSSFVKTFLEVGLAPEQVQESILKGDFTLYSPRVLSKVPEIVNLPESLPLVRG